MKQLYEIRPIRPIRIPGKPFINRAKQLKLEMEEVKQYMQYGPVYRIFENTTLEPVKVTGANLASLHGISEETTKIVDLDVKEEVVSVIEETDTVEDEVVEESKNLQEEECSIIEDDNIEDTTSSDELIEDDETVEESEDDVEDSEEETVKESSNNQDPKPWVNNNYNKYNKKHKK